jgi:hypothetical protein
MGKGPRFIARSGMCVNSRGVGTKEVCNYDLRNDRIITFWAVDYDVPERVDRNWSSEESVVTGRG